MIENVADPFSATATLTVSDDYDTPWKDAITRYFPEFMAFYFLVRVATLDGAEQWVYIHVEVQGGQDSDFGERLFTYNYRLYDKYRRPIASLAVLADDREHWKPERYGFVPGVRSRIVAFSQSAARHREPEGRGDPVRRAVIGSRVDGRQGREDGRTNWIATALRASQ